ncbi:MAG: glycosyltransferase [Anaerolineae bacterium]|nr:glycosyltransferase [Anaerolineae bacterium]
MISIVVPAYNAAPLLERCLRALQGQNLPAKEYEIIVVDDGSTDDTARVASAMGARLIRIPHGGPAAARNAGIRAARGEIILFTDADCEPTPHWARSLAAAFADPGVAGAKGTYLTRQRSLVARFVQVEYEERYRRMVKRSRIDFIDTYSAGYRREVLIQNEGFNPVFSGPTVEDQELSFRLAAKGYRLVFVPQAQVYHQHVTSPISYFRRKYHIGHGKAVMLKWLPEKAISDSHTPQTLKFQIVSLGIACVALPGGLLWQPLWYLAVASIGGFVLSTVPFIRYAWHRDRAVALVALPMLTVRAAALGSGLLVGMLRRGHRETQRPPITGMQRLAKRLLDTIAALTGLIIALPLLVALRVASPGRVLERRERVGLNGQPFRMYVLRPDGNSRLLRWLHRLGLDVLPQLANVLRGEMSLVGPCPEDPQTVPAYTDAQRRRLLVRPGIIGPAQLRGGLDLQARLALEVDYVEHYSLQGDFALLWRAIGCWLHHVRG